MKNKPKKFLRLILLSYLSVILSGCFNDSGKSEETTMQSNAGNEESVVTTKTLSKAFFEKGTWLILDEENITANTEIEQFLFFDGDGNAEYYDYDFSSEYTGEKTTLEAFASNEISVDDMITKHNTFKENFLQENSGESYTKPQPELINLGILKDNETAEYLSVLFSNIGMIDDSYTNLNETFQIEFIDSYSTTFLNGYLNGFEIDFEIKRDDRDQTTYTDEDEDYNSKILVRFEPDETNYIKDAFSDVTALTAEDILDEDDTRNTLKIDESQEADQETSESVSPEESSSESSSGNYNNESSYDEPQSNDYEEDYDDGSYDNDYQNDEQGDDYYDSNYDNDYQNDDYDEDYYDGNYENDYQYDEQDDEYYDDNYDNDYQDDDYDEDTYYNDNYEDDYLYRDDEYYDGNYENDDEHRW